MQNVTVQNERDFGLRILAAREQVPFKNYSSKHPIEG